MAHACTLCRSLRQRLYNTVRGRLRPACEAVECVLACVPTHVATADVSSIWTSEMATPADKAASAAARAVGAAATKAAASAAATVAAEGATGTSSSAADAGDAAAAAAAAAATSMAAAVAAAVSAQLQAAAAVDADKTSADIACAVHPAASPPPRRNSPEPPSDGWYKPFKCCAIKRVRTRRESLMREHNTLAKRARYFEGGTFFGDQKPEVYAPVPPPPLPELPSTCSCDTDDDECEAARDNVAASSEASQEE